MRIPQRVIPFPISDECSPPAEHIVSGGGMSVNIKHQHPTYPSEKERLERLREIIRACAAKINATKKRSRTA